MHLGLEVCLIKPLAKKFMRCSVADRKLARFSFDHWLDLIKSAFGFYGQWGSSATRNFLELEGPFSVSFLPASSNPSCYSFGASLPSPLRRPDITLGSHLVPNIQFLQNLHMGATYIYKIQTLTMDKNTVVTISLAVGFLFVQLFGRRFQ